MLILWIGLGAAAFYFLQAWIYARFWDHGISARLFFSAESAGEGELCYLSEQVENRKALPLPMLKVKFQVSRKLKFEDEGDSAVTDQYYRNDILSLGPNQRVTRRIAFRCTARGYYRISGLDLVASDLFLSREMVERIGEESVLYVYPRPARGVSLDAAIRRLNGEILAKRHLLEDPFEYRGIREYAPFDEQRSINWKATARMDELMVNMRGYTALRAVRIFLNLEDRGIWKRQELLELCIRIAARIASEMLRQGVRTAVYCNARDILSGEVMHLAPGAGAGHMEQLNRAFARLDLEEPAVPFQEVFGGELEAEGKDTATLFLSAETDEGFQELIGSFARTGADFTWMCPMMPRMESGVTEPERLHFVRLDAEEMLNE
ncbi:MAG TPA: DUF58 domain-containing protein [Candidatus Eisenbergiella merdipullorum]|uniref:DUF58 domain-containing protein n=1 Tax=Candidatus Eisenbergiella merdipullorum TaxID=2838553 RepID=A0A9D2L0M1_9FIRM|nr:DUF58 domain-containing protein [Candidatus Eisenbergiella merdipullorum]